MARWWCWAVMLCLLGMPAMGLATPERVLRDRMLGVGLDRVEPIPAATTVVRGFLPGEGGLTVLLFAGCGPGTEASLDAALIAVADLARTPRRHTLEVVACAGSDGAPASAEGASIRWLELHLQEQSREDLLAVFLLEPDAAPGGDLVGLVAGGSGLRGHHLSPAWLVHAALAGARVSGVGLHIGAQRWPLLGQLLSRHAGSAEGSGARPFLAAGVPALTLAGGANRAGGWSASLAGIVRRLDSLAGRPRDDDAFLALGGRVWSRRDLYWVGLAVFVVLMVGGLPGAWRGAVGSLRRQRARRYLPGFALRMLFLAALLIAPETSLLLLAPAALSTLVPLNRPIARQVGRVLAATPAALFAGYWLAMLAAGRAAAWPAQPFRLALLLAAVVLATTLVGGRPKRV
jgi:hypothetical protein